MMSAAQKQQLLKLTASDLAQLPPPAQAMVKATMQIRQSLYDIFGSFPQENVQPYSYSVSRTAAKGNAIAATATVQDSISVSSDAAFICTQVTGTSTGDYLLFPRQDASDRQIVNEAIHTSAFVGTGERPHYLPKPWLWPANTTVSFDFTNLTGVVNEVYLSFIGYKVYRRG